MSFYFGSSDGYTDQDVVYRWTSGRGVNIASDMKLSQFDLISTPTGNATGMTTDFNFILITFLKKAPILLDLSSGGQFSLSQPSHSTVKKT